MKRPHVAIYMPTLTNRPGKKGGVEAGIHRLAQTLSDRGVVDVTCFTGSAMVEGARYTHIRTLGYANRTVLLQLFLAPLLLNFLRFDRYDILHFHGNDWFYVDPPKVKVVRTYHGSALNEARFAATFKRRVFMSVCTGLEYLSAKLRHHRVAIGEDSRKIFDCQHLIGHGVDVDVFTPSPKTSYPSLCYIGLWGGRKRGKFLYDIFITDILPRYPDAKLYMVIDECPDHPAVVRLTGADDALVAQTVAASWVFAYPSLYEGFGIPFIEAMAAGTAIVTTDKFGAMSILDGGKYGVICDDVEFFDRLTEILDTPELRSALEKTGLLRAQLYTHDRIAQQYEDLYIETLKMA